MLPVAIKSMNESMVPITGLHHKILGSIGESPPPLSLDLAKGLRAAAAEFQIPLRELLLLGNDSSQCSEG